jgi:hypothetical protein
MADPTVPTREQLAKFLPNHEEIRRFERLFKMAGDLLPSDVAILYRLSQEAAIDAGTANSRAQSALDQLQRIASALELLVTRPSESQPNLASLDAINLNLNGPRSPQVGQVGWNIADDTVDIVQSDGVTQQVGLELYMRAVNHTGTTLVNGSCVGFAGVNGDVTIEIDNYLADGSMQSLYAIGILTQDIEDNKRGRVTVWGHVRNLDTTGAAYGETWAEGDILYASPTVAGGMTNIKPTAPDVVVPMAAVLEADATEGSIFVRPTIEQQKYYGTVVKTTNQSPAAINAAYAITFDSTETSNGVSIGTPVSRIVVDHAGLYNLSASFQLSSGSSSVKNVWLWFRKNGVDVPNSSLKTSLESGTALATPSRSLFFSLEAGDYIEIMFAADSTNVTLDALASTAFAPAAPACTLAVHQIQQ